MSTLTLNAERRIIPRWRNIDSASSAGELVVEKTGDRIDPLMDSFFRRHLEEWRDDRTLQSAVDIVGFAIVSGQNELAKDQAKYILDRKSDVSVNITRIAEQLIGLSPQNAHESHGSFTDGFVQSLKNEINLLKRKLRRWPRNALTWLELARIYTILGYEQKAEQAVTVALGLGRCNRYVVRSAARFFVHLGKPDVAKETLIKTDGFIGDPWLMATEIAVSTIIGRSSKNIGRGMRVVERGQLRPRDISELACALGTEEIASGANKAAKKLFIRGLVEPNDNSLAQALWATDVIGSLEIQRKIDVPNSYEVKAQIASKNRDWATALENCMQWLVDEPYSGRPAILGSHIASTLMERFDCGEELCRFAMRANPNDDTLKNNLAVILAYKGDTVGARKIFSTIGDLERKGRVGAVLKATAGLIRYREGEIEKGRELYLGAIKYAEKHGDHFLKGSALLHMSREESRIGDGSASVLLKEAKDIASKIKNELLMSMVDVEEGRQSNRVVQANIKK